MSMPNLLILLLSQYSSTLIPSFRPVSVPGTWCDVAGFFWFLMAESFPTVEPKRVRNDESTTQLTLVQLTRFPTPSQRPLLFRSMPKRKCSPSRFRPIVALPGTRFDQLPRLLHRRDLITTFLQILFSYQIGDKHKFILNNKIVLKFKIY